jgi:hypothetical protein
MLSFGSLFRSMDFIVRKFQVNGCYRSEVCLCSWMLSFGCLFRYMDIIVRKFVLVYGSYRSKFCLDL